MRKGINISHVNIENMGSRDQSQVKIKFKKFKNIKSIPITYQKVITMTGGDKDNKVVGVSPWGSMRPDSLMPPTHRLITEMEREAEEAGLGGWFNRNPEDVPESWSRSNSSASASQDRVGMTLLTTIGGRTLPNLVRVPNNIVYLAVLTSLMEGPI